MSEVGVGLGSVGVGPGVVEAGFVELRPAVEGVAVWVAAGAGTGVVAGVGDEEEDEVDVEDEATGAQQV